MWRWIITGICWIAVSGFSSPARAQATDRIEMTEVEIQRAVEALASPKFHVRERAMRQLWQSGLPAQAALQRIVAVGDAESSVRARTVLRDFEYGILPSTPTELRQRIAQFRDGNGRQKLDAFASLCRAGEIEIIEQLISIEPQIVARGVWLSQMFSDSSIVSEFTDPERVAALVQRVGADQEIDWQRNMTAALLFSPQLVTAFSDSDRLDDLNEFIETQSPEHRAVYLSRLFGNAGTTRTLALGGRQGFLLKMLSQANQSSTRHALAVQLFAGPLFAQSLAERGVLVLFLDQLAEQIDAETQQTILTASLRHSVTIAAVLRNDGFECLIELVDRVKDSSQRGTLLGQVISNPSVIAHLKSQDDLARIVALAAEERDPALQTAYLAAIVRSNILNTLAAGQSVDTMLALWSLIESSDNDTLRRDAIIRLIRVPAFVQLMNDRDAAEKLLTQIGSLDANLLASVLPMLAFQENVLILLQQADLLDELITMVCRLDAPRQANTMRQIVSRLAAQQQDPAQRQQLLIGLADELAVSDRWPYLVAVTRLPLEPAMAEALAERVMRDAPAPGEAPVLSTVWASQPLRAAFDSKPGRQWILDRLSGESPQTVYLVAGTFVNDIRRREAVVTSGQLEPLLQNLMRLDAQQTGPLVDKLLGVPAVIEQLDADDDLSDKVQQWRRQTDLPQ